MTCEQAQENVVLAAYGELPDELHFQLEHHLAGCEACRAEFAAQAVFTADLALEPVVEPSPNLLATARLRLDEALDEMPPRTVTARFRAHIFRWIGTAQAAPALMALILGAGFLGGTALTRYQVAHAPKLPTPVILSHTAQGAISSVVGITQTADPNIVQVQYDRTVPETIQGSLDDPQIRQLLVLGTKLAANADVHVDSVSLLANECRTGRRCDSQLPGTGEAGIRTSLMRAALYDRSPKARLKALNGLQPYVASDEQVRDVVLTALMRDPNEDVRTQAISLLSPVGADSSVRQVLRTVSAQDANPAIRTASFEALQGSADIE